MTKKDAIDQLREQQRTLDKALFGNPINGIDLDAQRELAKDHKLGTNINDWKNPHAIDDPRSMLLQYQCDYFSDPSRFKAWLASRQVGKDFSSEGEAAADCEQRTTEWMVAAPSERQALDSLDQAKLWAEAFEMKIDDYEERREGTTSETLLKSAEIKFSNNSRIRAVPGKPDTVRGRSANLLLTEFDFFEQPALTWRAILPSITNPLRGGEKKVRLVSTPNGRGGAMDRILSKRDGKMQWSRHLTTIYQAVLCGLPVDIEQLREMFDDPDGWAQEFECVFLDGSNVLLPYEIIQLAESFEATEAWDLAQAGTTHPTFLGIDFGRQNDPTVCWTLQQVGDVLWTREVLVLEKTTSPEQQLILSNRIKAASRVCFDYTGPGIGLGDYLVQDHREWNPAKHEFGKIELDTFTVGFKRELFPKLRRAFEAPTKLRIPVSTMIREDLHQMQQVVTNSEYNYWSPRTKLGHSDRCTALALALRAAGDGGVHFAYESLDLDRRGSRHQDRRVVTV